MCIPRRAPSVGFVAQTTNLSLLGFEAQNKKSLWWFWGLNNQTRATGFKAQTGKPVRVVWCQTTHKLSTLVLRLNQETRASHLHVHGADRTQRHPTFRSPIHRVPDLCDYPRSSAQIFYSCHDPRCYTPCRTWHLHTTRQATWFCNETKNKGKTTEMSYIRIQTSASQWLIIIKPSNRSLIFSIVSIAASTLSPSDVELTTI
jgi:hypothetical protein